MITIAEVYAYWYIGSLNVDLTVIRDSDSSL